MNFTTTMTLYHFTNRNNIEMILTDKLLKAGKHISNGGVKKGAISFTSDFDPMGHGLTDGREIAKNQVRGLRYASEHGNKYYCVDNTEFCLQIDLPLSDKLIHAMKFHTPNEISALSVTAYLPCSPNPNINEINRIKNMIDSGKIKVKSNTWWYYLDDLVLADYIVHHKQKNGSYVALKPLSHCEIDLVSIPKVQIYEYS